MNIVCKSVIQFEGEKGASIDQAVEEAISVCQFLKAEIELTFNDITLYLNRQSELDKCLETYWDIKNKKIKWQI